MLFSNTKQVVEVSSADFLDIINSSDVYNYLENINFATIKGYDRFEQRSEIFNIILRMIKDYFLNKSDVYVCYGENYSAHGIGNNSRKPIYLIEENKKYILGYVSVVAGIFPEISISFLGNDLEKILPIIDRNGSQGVR